MDKGEQYLSLLREHDKLSHKLSQLKSTNAGINLSDVILKEIEKTKQDMRNIEIRATELHR